MNLQRNKRAELTVSIPGSGTATAVMSVPPGPSWELKQVSVECLNSTTIPIATTYVGVNANGVFVSSTLLGDGDTDSQPNTTLRTGESFCCVWVGASSGSVARLTIIYDEVAY